MVRHGLRLTVLTLLLSGVAGAMPIEKKGSGVKGTPEAEELIRARARAQEEYRRMRAARRRALEKAREEVLSGIAARPPGRVSPGSDVVTGGSGSSARRGKGRDSGAGSSPAGGSLPVILVGTLFVLYLGIRVFCPDWLLRRRGPARRDPRGSGPG